MDIGDLDLKRDREAVHRIWHEVGWGDSSDDFDMKGLDIWMEACSGRVARIDGDAECAVLCTPGKLRYLDQSLRYLGVMSVVTSHVARKQGFAGRVTASSIARHVANGVQVAGLGIFEQGYYNRLGFGTDAYENLVAIDPQQLSIAGSTRPPKRLGTDDWKLVHHARCSQTTCHGGVTFDSPLVTRRHQLERKGGFGLGYFEGDTLTHHLWFRPISMENGPLDVVWMSYTTGEQFVELMGLVKNLGDQVRLVRMREPAGIQLHDLLRQPIQSGMTTERSKFATGIESLGISQTRICDMEGCMDKTHLECEDLKFNLKLTDPIELLLDDTDPWRGAGGDYVVSLGTSSGAERGSDSSLPTLEASVGAFTRMWLGVRPASGLTVTDALHGPQGLIESLDVAFRLPTPKRTWEF